MNIDQYQLIFWDFDGVIKESVDAKTHAFIRLFDGYGRDVAEKIRRHHVANGGMSRFDKLPLYLRWAGEYPSEDLVREYCDRFSRLVFQSVIDSPWVPGVENYLRSNPHQQKFVLVSATPQDELDLILQALDLKKCFTDVFGAPTSKKDAIRMTLKNLAIDPPDCLMIGDAPTDMEAAQASNVPFLLRLHASNAAVFANYKGITIKDLTIL